MFFSKNLQKAPGDDIALENVSHISLGCASLSASGGAKGSGHPVGMGSYRLLQGVLVIIMMVVLN